MLKMCCFGVQDDVIWPTNGERFWIFFKIISLVFWTMSTMVLLGFFHVKVVKKAEICENLLKKPKKCKFWGQDDVIHPKLKIFGKKCFNIISWVLWTIYIMVLWDNFHVIIVKKAKICKICSKCPKGEVSGVKMTSQGQNDDKFSRKIVSNNLRYIVNNLNHSFMG